MRPSLRVKLLIGPPETAISTWTSRVDIWYIIFLNAAKHIANFGIEYQNLVNVDYRLNHIKTLVFILFYFYFYFSFIRTLSHSFNYFSFQLNISCITPYLLKRSLSPLVKMSVKVLIK
jgi:hypothetical protein